MYKIILTYKKLYKSFNKWTWLFMREMREATLTKTVGNGHFSPSPWVYFSQELYSRSKASTLREDRVAIEKAIEKK